MILFDYYSSVILCKGIDFLADLTAGSKGILLKYLAILINIILVK